MGLNLSTAQIALALDRHADDVYHRTISQRTAPKKSARVGGAVECDVVSVGVGHTGSRANFRAQGQQGRRYRVAGARGRDTSVQEKPQGRTQWTCGVRIFLGMAQDLLRAAMSSRSVDFVRGSGLEVRQGAMLSPPWGQALAAAKATAASFRHLV
jgi:hypothetical protein